MPAPLPALAAPAPHGGAPGVSFAPAAPAAPAVPGPAPAPDRDWHRYHLAVGVFLLGYGCTRLLGTLFGWHHHERQIAGYLDDTIGLGPGAAAPVLIAVKLLQLLLTLIVLAGVLRRKDVWYLPALTGWIAGFAGFCVLDLWAGRLGRLIEHGVLLAGFTALLIISYGLSVRVRVARGAADRSVARTGTPGPTGLSRTQEIALAALNRWQRGGS